MWLKQCPKPPMTGNGNRTTYKNGDDWGMVYDCLTTLYTDSFMQREYIYNLKKYVCIL